MCTATYNCVQEGKHFYTIQRAPGETSNANFSHCSLPNTPLNHSEAGLPYVPLYSPNENKKSIDRKDVGDDESRRLPAKVRASVATRKTSRGPGALGTRVGSIHAGGAQGDRWQPTESRTPHRQMPVTHWPPIDTPRAGVFSDDSSTTREKTCSTPSSFCVEAHIKSTDVTTPPGCCGQSSDAVSPSSHSPYESLVWFSSSSSFFLPVLHYSFVIRQFLLGSFPLRQVLLLRMTIDP